MCRDTKEKPRLQGNVCSDTENSEGMPKKGIPFCALCGFGENGLTFYIPVGIIRVESMQENVVNVTGRGKFPEGSALVRFDVYRKHDKQWCR